MKPLTTIRNNNVAAREPYFFDDFFDDQFAPLFRPFFPEPKHDGLMKTDIKETETNFVLEVEVPGFKKENIEITLENGYLTISAKKEVKEVSDKERFLRKERCVRAQRSFYVGDIKEEDIKAKYEDGILTVTFPKESKKEDVKKGIVID